jgi:hypothetical protein
MNTENLVEKELTMYHRGLGVKSILEEEIEFNVWYHTYYLYENKVIVKEFVDEIYDNRVFETDTLEEAIEEANFWKNL